MSRFGTNPTAEWKCRAGAVLMAALLALPPLPAAAQTMPAEMFRLAEVLGAVHHLRTVCGTREGQLWRNKMIEMLGAVGPGDEDRQKLIARFNEAFHSTRDRHAACSRDAAAQSDKLFEEGQRIARELAVKGYGR
ncbi:MAG: TIGR02301 family protein [Parvibaculum sp.]|nr:TIGR02301 family protein [Parvibaculum sp.]